MAVSHTRSSDPPLELASDEDSDFASVRAALAVLRNARPKRQRQFLTACELVMLGNGALSLAESELFRAIVVSLGVPLPPRAVRSS